MNPPLKIKPPPIQWSPLATMGLTTSIGSYIGTKIPASLPLDLTLMLVTITLLVVGLFFTRAKTKQSIIATCLLLLFIAKSNHLPKAPPWTLDIANDLSELELTVVSDSTVSPRTKGEMAKFDHRTATTWFYAQATPHPKISQKIVTGVQIEGEHALKKGKTIKCVGWLRESHKQKGHFVFYSITPPQNSGLDQSLTTHMTNTKPKPKETTQWRIRELLTSRLSPNQKTLASALFLGIRESGWEKISNQFRKAGMSHILAISGLHVALLLGIATIVLTPKRLGLTWNAAIIFLTIFLLASIIEPRAPVIRAYIMATTISILKLVGSRFNTISLLGFAAILFLSLNPTDAGAISFQLSFIVVASLCVLLPQIQWRAMGPSDPNGKIRTLMFRWSILLWLTGVCAWCIAAPIVSHVFNTVSPSGLLSSVPSILLLMFTVLVGVIKTSIAITPEILQLPIDYLFSETLGALMFTARYFGSFTFSFFTNTTLSWLQSLVIVVWFICWSLVTKKRALLWISALAIVCFIYTPKRVNNATITTLNVGHGTCHIIQSGEYTAIIDAGSRGNLDVGTKTIIPRLHSLGTKKIETIIITHADLDHLVGIVDVVKQFKTQKIVVAPQTLQHKTPLLDFVLNEAVQNGAMIQSGSAGWQEKIGSTTLTILSPGKNEPFRSSNASSIVLHAEIFSRSLLFTGDIDEKRISKLLRVLQSNTEYPRRFDVIELPHHGEWSEESQKLINTLRPTIALQSTNLARHSKDEWRIPKDTVRLVTAIDGDITTTITEGGEIVVSTSNAPATMSPCVFTN